jgi:superfamily II DNA or RNA helicase
MSLELHKTIQYRDYQREAMQAVFDYLVNNPTGHPLVSAPGGSGKAVMIAGQIYESFKMFPYLRVLQIVHTQELVEQNYLKLLKLWHNAPAGIYCAGLNRKDTNDPIIFGSMSSMVNNIEAFGFRNLILIDESHTVSPEEETSYRKIIDVLTAINPNLRVIGYSATNYRLGQGCLTDGGFFTDICFDITTIECFNRLIAEGYLAALVPRRTSFELDISNVGMSKGDFAQGTLQKAVDKQEVTFAAIREAIELGFGRFCWLVFASGIEHCEHISEILNSFGIATSFIHSKITKDERNKRLIAFKTGELRCLVGFRVLTTGFDHPPIDFIIDLYPTVSPGMHVQKLSRGTRPYDCNNPEQYIEGFNYVKLNCIAEGELVLTNKGLVPIEEVSLDMLLWDGYNWVTHCGIVFKGEQETITYAGLTGTEDHRVWTEEGWQTLRRCADKQIAIAQTGIAEQEIREIDCHFVRDIPKRKEQRCLSFGKMRLRIGRYKVLQQRYRRKGWLSYLWTSTKSSEMVEQSNYFSKTKMHKSKRSSLRKIRSKGDRVSIQILNRNGFVYSRNVRFEQKQTNRSDRQQRSLRAWKSKILNSRTKFSTYSKGNAECSTSCVQRAISRNKICRFYYEDFSLERNDFQRNSGKILPIFKKTKRRVWDIVNAGPLHRFTVSGILVSNCLVLDYSGNTRRLGPINDVLKPRKKGEKVGEAPIKVCEACGIYNHSSARYCGGKPYPTTEGCGAEFVFKTKLVRTAGTDELIAGDVPTIEIFDVNRVLYHKHTKIGSSPSLKVSYFVGLQRYTEWIGIEAKGYAHTRAKSWWQQRHASDIPETVDEALLFVSQLRTPKRIHVITSSQYPEIRQVEW